MYSIVHVYFINCFNAKLFREILTVAPAVRFQNGVRCNDVGQYVKATHFAISARERNSRLCVKCSPTGG